MAVSPEIGNAMQQNSESVPKYSTFARAAESSSNRFGLKCDSGPQKKSFADGVNAVEADTNRKIQGQYPRVQPAMIPNTSWFDGTPSAGNPSTRDRQSTDQAPASSMIHMMGHSQYLTPNTTSAPQQQRCTLLQSNRNSAKSRRTAEIKQTRKMLMFMSMSPTASPETVPRGFRGS